MAFDIKAINEKIHRESEFIDRLLAEMRKTIIGQQYMVERLLIGLLSNGHILLEGVPGLAKTLSVKTLAGAIQAKFQRIQFTPDLLPADLVAAIICERGVIRPADCPGGWRQRIAEVVS